MSLRINTNIPAMTAMRNVGQNESRMAGAITRLSTGLRINNAGDDPAGLIISEGLRAQIRGLDQAIRNSQDAVNMARTAEGSMDEVQTLLRNIRALAVHSANTAVVDASQLQANQAQIRATVESINRIAEHTSWGTKKLLNGSAGATVGITQTNLAASMFIGSEFGGEIVRSGPIQIQRTTEATRTTTTLSGNFADATAPAPQGAFVLNGVTFNVEPGESIGSVIAKMNQRSHLTNVVAELVGNNVRLTSTQFGSNFPIEYLETANIMNGGTGSTPAPGANAVFSVTVPTEPTPNTSTEVFTGGQGPGIDGLTLTSPSGARLRLTAAGNAEAGLTTIGALSVGSLKFQIGANVEQITTFSIPSLFANQLGRNAVSGMSVADLDVTSQQGAEAAIRIIDDAIQGLALLRGELGSFQTNFLESTVRSLGIAQENITASESMIRDADIAYEMTEFTKIQILRQSGMSVLAQASQSPQAILQLLNG